MHQSVWICRGHKPCSLSVRRTVIFTLCMIRPDRQIGIPSNGKFWKLWKLESVVQGLHNPRNNILTIQDQQIVENKLVV